MPLKAQVTSTNETARNEKMFNSTELFELKIDQKINELARANKLKMYASDKKYNDAKVNIVVRSVIS